MLRPRPLAGSPTTGSDVTGSPATLRRSRARPLAGKRGKSALWPAGQAEPRNPRTCRSQRWHLGARLRSPFGCGAYANAGALRRCCNACRAARTGVWVNGQTAGSPALAAIVLATASAHGPTIFAQARVRSASACTSRGSTRHTPLAVSAKSAGRKVGRINPSPSRRSPRPGARRAPAPPTTTRRGPSSLPCPRTSVIPLPSSQDRSGDERVPAAGHVGPLGANAASTSIWARSCSVGTAGIGAPPRRRRPDGSSVLLGMHPQDGALVVEAPRPRQRLTDSLLRRSGSRCSPPPDRHRSRSHRTDLGSRHISATELPHDRGPRRPRSVTPGGRTEHSRTPHQIRAHFRSSPASV